MSHYSLYTDYWGIATPGIWSGIGTGLFFVPLTAVAFGSIRKAQYDEASGVYALMRGIGGSGRHRRGELAVRAANADSLE